MDKDTTLKLGIWLASKEFQPWKRGKNDCCTLFMEWHDKRFGTNTLDEIYGKYNDLMSAIRFARNFVKVPEWFPKHGYVQVDKPETGDIVMVEHHKNFCSGYIVCMNQAWGIQEHGKGLSKHALRTMQPHTIWRHANGF
jgi:hypothetical protein